MKYLQDGHSVNGVQNRSPEYIQDGDDDEDDDDGDDAAVAAAADDDDDANDDEGKAFIQLLILGWPKYLAVRYSEFDSNTSYTRKYTNEPFFV